MIPYLSHLEVLIVFKLLLLLLPLQCHEPLDSSWAEVPDRCGRVHRLPSTIWCRDRYHVGTPG